MTRNYRILLGLIFLSLCIGRSAAQDPPGKDPAVPEVDTTQEDLKTLRDSGLKGDGPDLLEYFRKRTFKQPDPKQIAALVKQLGDEDFAAREKAFIALRDMGASAMTGIKLGETDPDLEVRKRIIDLRQRVETKTEPLLLAAAARMLARLKPAGSADVLMAYLPFATDALVVDAVSRTLGAVALHNGKVEPILVKGLADPNPVKRGAAGEALVRARLKSELPAVKQLLKDPDASVRLRVSMAMLPLGDKDILPVLIDLLADLTPNQLWPVEEALLRLAGEKAPSASLGTDATSRKACRDAWQKWLVQNDKTIDMAKLVQNDLILGYTLIVQQNNFAVPGRNANGEIYELDTKKNVRWKFNVPTYPVDAQMVNGGRVLVAEYQGNRVSERDTKGEVKWEYHCGGNPFAVQRLANGNTFIAMQGRLIEVNRDHKAVWSYQRPQHDIVRARMLPTGEIAFITNQGNQATYTRMDPRTQKVNKTFRMMQVSMLFGNFEVLRNGHVVVPHYQQRLVVEYDQNGDRVGQPLMKQQLPNSVVRLPNGNSLVTSQNLRQINEYDRDQNVVWSYTTNGIVFVARRR